MENLIARDEVLRQTGLSPGQFSHLKNLGLIGDEIRRFEGRENGVRSYYPGTIIETIRSIRGRLAKGTSLVEQSLGRVDRPAPVQERLDRHWLITQFRNEQHLRQVRADVIDAYFEALAASGVLRGELDLVEDSEPERDLVQFSTPASGESILKATAMRIGQASRHGLQYVVGILGLDRAQLVLAAKLARLDAAREPVADDEEQTVRVALLYLKRQARLKAALRLVERELKKLAEHNEQ